MNKPDDSDLTHRLWRLRLHPSNEGAPWWFWAFSGGFGGCSLAIIAYWLGKQLL